MEAGLREVCRSVRIGKILIQRVRSVLHTCCWLLIVHLTGRGDCVAKAFLFKGWFLTNEASIFWSIETGIHSFLKILRWDMCCCLIRCWVCIRTFLDDILAKPHLWLRDTQPRGDRPWKRWKYSWNMEYRKKGSSSLIWCALWKDNKTSH